MTHQYRSPMSVVDDTSFLNLSWNASSSMRRYTAYRNSSQVEVVRQVPASGGDARAAQRGLSIERGTRHGSLKQAYFIEEALSGSEWRMKAGMQ